MTEGNRQREQESKRAHYRPPTPRARYILALFPVPLLLPRLSRNVGHFGPTLARPTGADLASDLGVHVEFIGKVNYPRKNASAAVSSPRRGFLLRRMPSSSRRRSSKNYPASRQVS